MASFDDDDEDLKRAVALSLQHSSPAAAQTSAGNTVDLTSDTEIEDDDVRRAIALSLGEVEEAATPGTFMTAVSQKQAIVVHPDTESKRPAVPPAPPGPNVSAGKPIGFLGIDRKAMEQERLARLGKRKRDPSPHRPSKQIAMAPLTKTEHPSSKQVHLLQPAALQYPRGVLKRTFATKYPRTDDITIDEVLQADEINIAVISSFMWDSEWLNKKLDPLKVKQIWIMNAKGRDIQQRWEQEMKECGIPNLKIHFPPMDGIIHSMHSKFMLLFGKDKLRFVVPTANMTPIDWGEVKNDWQPGVMENSMFLIDLPRRDDGALGSKSELTAFGKELVYFLEKQEVARNVIEGVLKFDFAQTGHLAFLHSVGGAHKGDLQHPTGLPGLAEAIHDLKLNDVKNIELDYAASSLGAINDSFLQRIYLAACGRSPAPNTTMAKVRDHMRIYFPTADTVQKSHGGPDCGGIISLTRQYYNAATFPRECLRDYDSTRRGMLSHNKLLFARGRKKDGKSFAWVYVGSANISESAWGGQKVLKSGQMGSLNIRNWECGVLMPVPGEKLVRLELEEGEVPPMSVFEGTIEVPFVHPGEDYSGRQPWFLRP